VTRTETGTYYFHDVQVSFFCISVALLNFKTCSFIQFNWFEARNFCLRNGMHLASFENVEEMRTVTQIAPRRGQFQINFVFIPDFIRLCKLLDS